MTSYPLKLGWSIALAGIICLPAVSQAQFDDLLRRIPDSANAVVVINVNQIHDCPIAQQNNWKEEHAKRFSSCPMVIPPDATRCVLAAQLDLESLLPMWELAVLEFDKVPSIAEIASTSGGHAESVGGKDAALLPIGAYVVQLQPNTLGVMLPANRQNLSRWVQKPTTPSVQLSPYLAKMSSYADNAGTEFIMALDLTDALPIREIRNRLQASPLFENKDVDINRLARVLSTTKGIALGVRFGETMRGEIKIDFGEDVSMLSDFAKPMLLKVLADHSASIDDFEKWETKVDGTSISIKGNLSKAGMRQIFSLIDTPSDAFRSAPHDIAQSSTDQNQQDPVASTSQQYYRAVVDLVDELKARRKKAKTLAQGGVWMEQYAQKIDRLPILNVDEDLLKYGAAVGEALRQASMAVKGIGIRSGARTASIYSYIEGEYAYSGYRGYRNYPYGGRARGYSGYARYQSRNVDAQRRAVRAEEKAKGVTAAMEIMAQIDKATAEIRKTMTQRYQVEF